MKGPLIVSGTLFLTLVLLLTRPLAAQDEMSEKKLKPVAASENISSSQSLEEIVEIVKRFEKGINAKDIGLTMSVIAPAYSDNNLDNNPPWPLYEPFKSKDALREGFERVFKLTDELHFDFSKPELEIKENEATGHIWVRQSYNITANFEGRMRIDLVKEKGQWRISRWEWDYVFDLEELRASRDMARRGARLLRKGNEKGLNILREAVKKYPHSANYAQLEIADYYFCNNDFERASEEYRKVLDIWATGYTTGPTPAQRARKLISIIEEFSSSPALLKAYVSARKLEKDGKREEAIKAYKDFADSYPDASCAPYLMSRVCLWSRDVEDKVELIKRYPYSKEAQRLVREEKLRPDYIEVERLKPEALSSLIESYPDAPWVNDAKEIIENNKNKAMREAETPAVKNAVRRYLFSLEAIDFVATLDSINKEFLAIYPGRDKSYVDIKRLAEHLDLSNVRILFLISDEKYVVHPDGKHAAAFLMGKEIFDIFRNGSCYMPDRHEYGTASFTLEKERHAWKVTSYIWSDLSPSEDIAKKADAQEIELLKKWEQDVKELENRQRIARTLEGIGERYEALDMKEEAERIAELLKQKYSDTYVVKGMLEKKVGEHFFIRYNIPEEYADAILNLCEVAYQGYKEVYGIDLLKDYPDPKIQITARFGGRLALWVAPDSNPDINLVAPNIERLGPPRQAGGKGAHHVYGFVHEMGHITIAFDEEKGAWTQGIAHYIGSQLLPYVEKRLGDKAWPVPYDYVNIEGPPRLMKGIEKAEPGTHDAACKVLYEIEKKHGPKVIGQAVYKTKEMGHSSLMPGGVKQYPIENFKSALIEITGDKEIEKLFSDNGF